MIEGKHLRHSSKLNYMSDTKIMVILILFHYDSFRYFKHYYKEYVFRFL